MSDIIDQFKLIETSLSASLVYSTDAAIIAEGDSIELLRLMPPKSVSLILTDPPYHCTKKKNIHGDTSFSDDDQYIEWMSEYAKEWKRVLKPNGSLFCFCASVMSAKLELMLTSEFNVLNHITWTKPNAPGFDGWKGKVNKKSLRKWYNHSERILFAELNSGNQNLNPFAEMLREYRIKSGLTMKELTALVGAHGKINHGGAVSNWESGRNVPNREQYEKIQDAIIGTGNVGLMPLYEDVMPLYEDAVRVFETDATKQFTDVWDFQSVRPYKGKHPAEKPIPLLEHAIESTTRYGDIVLDCFGGSGNTAIAALRLGRKTISLEIEPIWSNRIATLVKNFDAL